MLFSTQWLLFLSSLWPLYLSNIKGFSLLHLISCLDFNVSSPAFFFCFVSFHLPDSTWGVRICRYKYYIFVIFLWVFFHVSFLFICHFALHMLSICLLLGWGGSYFYFERIIFPVLNTPTDYPKDFSKHSDL